MPEQTTILIPARNAANTIERAVKSAVAQGNYPIILVNDYSTDDTVFRAKDIAGSLLTSITPPQHISIGMTRQFALSHIKTPYGVWLDADDELLPGRIERFTKPLKDGIEDIVCDEVELYDGTTSSFRSILTIPEFVQQCKPLARLFERNYLPGIGVIGFRTSFSQRIGYDAALNGAEDIDFMLRAIVAKARIHLFPVPGYRQYAYPDSLSRRIDNQRKMYAIALAKHDYADVARLYEQASFSKHVTIWGLISMAIFRSDYDSVLQFLSECALLIDAPEEILEPAVCAKPEGWRLRFHRGTTLLQMGKTKESLDDLYAIEADIPTAEGANNLGVALAKAGALTEATRLFQLAITRQPSYFDAEQNLKNIGEYRITSHLIRSTPFRYEYLPMPESGSSI